MTHVVDCAVLLTWIPAFAGMTHVVDCVDHMGQFLTGFPVCSIPMILSWVFG